MLSIPNELKEILKHDYLPYRAPVEKSLVLYFADLGITITDESIQDDTFSFEDSLCGDTLTFGSCNSACIKFNVEDVTRDLVGHQFTAKFIMTGTEIKLGTFIVSEAPKADEDNVKSVVAYDLMSKFDVDVTEWYNDIDFDPGVTLKEFRESLCIYCGVKYESSNLPNDNMIIERTISTNQLKGRDVLIRCEELNSCFGHMNRDGKLDHIVLSKSNPVDTLDNTSYDTLVLEEYTTDVITKVQIRQEDGDVGAYYGDGTNCYSITGNFLVYGKSASELAAIVQNAAPNIIGITYRPYECDGQGLPYYDVGDYITFNGEETVNSYIMSNAITGTQILDATMSAKGDKALSEDTGVNVQIEQLKGKSNVLNRTVEEMSNTITNLETTTGTQKQAIETLKTGVTGLEQDINGVAGDVSGVVTNLQAEITRATGVEANMYTKSQTDSKISQTTTSIKNEVASTYVTQATYNNMQIGGRNLYLGTKDFSREAWINKASYDVDSQTYNGFTVLKKASAWNGLCQLINVCADEVYTLSAYIKVDSGEIVNAHANCGSAGTATADGYINSVGVTTSWRRYSFTFTVKTDGTLRPGFEHATTTGKMYICGLKLERGNKATDWSPAPEDAEVSIGGRNLILNSTGNYDTAWNKSSNGWSGYTTEGYNGSNGIKVFSPSTDTSRRNVTQRITKTFGTNNLEVVTLSFWYKADVSCDTQGVGALIRVAYNNSTSTYKDIIYHLGKTVADGNWHYTSITNDTSSYTGLEGIIEVTLYLFAYKGYVTYSRVKLERGNKATDWTPAPEDTDNQITDINTKFASYSTTTQMNTSLELLQNEIEASVSESYATKLEVQTVDGKFTNYVKTADYNTKVTALSTGLSAEVTAREEFETQVISPYVCNVGKKCGVGVKCGTGNTIVNQLVKDNMAKMELLSDKFNVELQDNVDNLQSQLTLTASEFSTQISNLKTSTSTQIQQLDNEISLKLTTAELCNELNISTDGINITGNRFTWSATNSSMSKDGTLTCNNIVATNGKFSGQITGSTFTAGSKGSNYTYIDSSAVVSTHLQIYPASSSYASNYANMTNSKISFSLNGSEAAYYGVDTMSVPTAYITTLKSVSTINGNTPITSANINSQSVNYAAYAGNAISADKVASSDVLVSLTTPGNIIMNGDNAATPTWCAKTFQPLSSSDMRLKRNIKSVENIEEFYMALKPKLYEFKGDLDDGYTHYGLLAQEVLSNAECSKINVNGLVREYETRGYYDEGMYVGEKAYRIDYESLHAMHIKMIQNQQKEIMELSYTAKNQYDEIIELNQKVERLEKLIA